MKANYIPAGYHTATPYLIVNGGARAIEDWSDSITERRS
jgi:hypothetical protein